MLVYFAFVDSVAIATSAIGLLRLPAESKSRACVSFAFLSANTGGTALRENNPPSRPCL